MNEIVILNFYFYPIFSKKTGPGRHDPRNKPFFEIANFTTEKYIKIHLSEKLLPVKVVCIIYLILGNLAVK